MTFSASAKVTCEGLPAVQVEADYGSSSFYPEDALIDLSGSRLALVINGSHGTGCGEYNNWVLTKTACSSDPSELKSCSYKLDYRTDNSCEAPTKSTVKFDLDELHASAGNASVINITITNTGREVILKYNMFGGRVEIGTPAPAAP